MPARCKLSRFQAWVAGWSTLKNAQARIRIAGRESVETGAENDVLRHALPDRLRQLIFGITAACRDKCPKGASDGTLSLFLTRAQFFGCFTPNDRQGQRIVQHSGMVKKLVRGAPNRNPMGCPAEFPFLQPYYPVSAARTALHSSQGQTSRRNCHE
jgi:hypothetical protein